MSNLVQWPKHLRYNCPEGQARCIEGRCMFCEGGLFSCVSCGGFEGSLTTDCPGSPMNADQQDEVYAGQLDYTRTKGWYCPKEVLTC